MSKTGQVTEPQKQMLIDRWIGRWTYQNQTLWGRLQTLGVLQVPILAGWYFLWSKFTCPENYMALLVAGAGAVISWGLYRLIQKDSDWRDECMEEVIRLAKDIKIEPAPFYEKPPFNDTSIEIILHTAQFFCALNAGMLGWTFGWMCQDHTFPFISP